MAKDHDIQSAASNYEYRLWWALVGVTALAGIGWTLFVLAAMGQM